MMKELCTISKQTMCQHTIEQTKVIQEIVSLGVFKVNHAVRNKNRDQMQIFPEKKARKNKMVNETG